MPDFRDALRAIEADVTAGNYRPGGWEKCLRVLRRLALPTLPIAGAMCTAAFWIIVLANAGLLLSAFAGRRRIGSLRLAITGGGVAGAELREALLDQGAIEASLSVHSPVDDAVFPARIDCQ